jgi:excisionase family DNA binding protein
MSDKPADVWLGVTEAAEMLGVDGATLFGLAQRGVIAATRIGLAVCFKLADIQQLIEQGPLS